jgi:hypothetical protein
MTTPANDNLGSIRLAIAHSEDFPDHVWIAMNRPGAVYRADELQVFAIVSDLVEKMFPPQENDAHFHRNSHMHCCVPWVTERGRWVLGLREWTDAEREFVMSEAERLGMKGRLSGEQFAALLDAASQRRCPQSRVS